MTSVTLLVPSALSGSHGNNVCVYTCTIKTFCVMGEGGRWEGGRGGGGESEREYTLCLPASISPPSPTLKGPPISLTDARCIVLKMLSVSSCHRKMQRGLAKPHSVTLLSGCLGDVSQENVTNAVITLANMAQNVDSHNMVWNRDTQLLHCVANIHKYMYTHVVGWFFSYEKQGLLLSYKISLATTLGSLSTSPGVWCTWGSWLSPQTTCSVRVGRAGRRTLSSSVEMKMTVTRTPGR